MGEILKFPVALAVLLPSIGHAAEAADVAKLVAAKNVSSRLGEMITIPAGSFLKGNNGNEPFSTDAELPQHRVDLPAYAIGKYEVTRGQYRRFIEAGGYDEPSHWSKEGWRWKEQVGRKGLTQY